MQQVSGRGATPGKKAVRPIPRELADWDTARGFLAVARRRSLRSAALNLGLCVNVVRQRISKLEGTLGVTLFTRHINGARLTAEGETILDAATRMEAASFDVLRARDQVDSEVAGEVRLAVTEGLATYWIVPHLAEFKRANPKLLIDLNCALKSADVLRLEADLSVQLTRPSEVDLLVVKLGRLHFMVYASESYLEAFGQPKDQVDLRNHKLLIQATTDRQWADLYDRVFPGVPVAELLAWRSNVPSAHLWSVVAGGGIGVLPTYVSVLGVPIVPLDVGVHETIDIWLTYHPDVKRIARVREVINWLIKRFSPATYPWFRDEFVHPHDFAKAYRGPTLPKLLANVMKPNNGK